MLNCLVISLNHALILSQTKNKGEKRLEADLTSVDDMESDVSILDQVMTLARGCTKSPITSCAFLEIVKSINDYTPIFEWNINFISNFPENRPVMGVEESVTANKSSKQ